MPAHHRNEPPGLITCLAATPASDSQTAASVTGILDRRAALPHPPASMAIPDNVALAIAVQFTSATRSSQTLERFSTGKTSDIGGTSAVAPLWAALVCRLAEGLGRLPGPLAPRLYAGITAGTAATGLRDITTGTNGAYTAGPGWDPCTGLGGAGGEAPLTRLRTPGA